MKWIRTLLCGSIVSGFMLSTAHAETIEELTNSLNNLNQQVSEAQSQKNQLQDETTQLVKALESINNQIHTNKSSIDQIQKDIRQQNQKISQNQSELDQTEHEFGQRAKVMYEEGNDTFLDVILQSTSFDDFITRLEAFRMIGQNTENNVMKIQALQDTIVKEKQDNQQKLATVQQKQQDLNTLLATKTVIQQQKKAQMAVLDQTITAKQADAARVQAMIEFEKKEALLAQQHPIQDGSDTFSTGVTYPGSAGAIISKASQFRGIPYIWGGTSTTGFDCSGFTQYIFRQDGIPLSRTASTQFRQGISISTSDLKPGDLVFFSTYGPGATHVGIYIGYNMMIDAQDNGVSVDNIGSSYWGPRYIGARRILS